MPQEQQIRDTVTAYVDSFNTQDRERFVALFAEDVVQIDPVGSTPNRGVQALAAFWDGLFASVEKVDFQITDLIVSGDEAALSFHIVQTKPDAQVVVDGIDVFRLDESGRIVEVKGYVDQGHIRVSES
ncbi:SgcJ/EcaC family oxidoreductase [Streptacidiphilus fuscans]|uniref:SgcJ/EcaC family oxidoreductase n=1 Tax=Streptacidiphilus fuscans TaxID=2789292 RepID=A0A931B3Y1_9ACTN|nr:SgcJ/EcaC family oxidoreductase [Streptacidiphilus fuscans]MBF9070765.1 SgcJ/EcaC family oxidoreductase [Streptacidiphilus fuscans]